jgi:molybdopterin-guanine dinucleotide biosynthesis protein A
MVKVNGIHGVILAGGHSSRMGQDKASLVYNGQTQLGRCRRLLRPVCRSIFVSVREDQPAPREFEHDRVIRDHFGPLGPLGGILSAMRRSPERPWLVLACDLPFVDRRLLQRLVDSRAPQMLATTFVRAGEGHPEALCTLYEPAAFGPLREAAENGLLDPCAVLAELPVHRIDVARPEALVSIKSQRDYQRALTRIGPTPNPFAVQSGG